MRTESYDRSSYTDGYDEDERPLTDKTTHTPQSLKNERNSKSREDVSTRHQEYQSDTSEKNMNFSRLVSTAGRESDSTESESHERKTHTPSSIESGNSAPEDTQALIDDIQTLLHEFDHHAVISGEGDTTSQWQ
jgi:hypothetical protein